MDISFEDVQALLVKFRKGDQRALLDLQKLCKPLIYAVCGGMLKDKSHPYIFNSLEQATHDCASEVWVKLVKKIMSEESEPLGKNPGGFINTIAQRTTIDFLRMIKRKNIDSDTDEGLFFDSVEGSQDKDEDQSEKLSIEQELQENSEGHAEETWLRYLAEIKEEIFPRLTVEEQNVFDSLLLDETREETATKLGVSVSTVKNRKKNIEEKVRSILSIA